MHGEHKSLLSILGSNKDAIVSNENILPFTEHGLVQSILQNRSRYGGMEIGQEIDLHKNLNQEDFYPRFR